MPTGFNGKRLDCTTPTCHGVTLESELGNTANGLAQPDYLDWEVKAHQVGHLNAHLSSKDHPAHHEPRQRGSQRQGHLLADPSKRKARSHRHTLGPLRDPQGGQLHPKTHLEFGLVGFDAASRTIVDDGYLYLYLYLYFRDPQQDLDLGRWSFAKLLTRWQTNHAKAVFVPCIATEARPREYSYGTKIHVGEGTSFLHYLGAMANGSVVLDPGLNTK